MNAMNFEWMLILGTSLCVLFFTTRRQFQKTRSVEIAFQKGFAYWFTLILLTVLLYEIDERQFPLGYEKVLTSVAFVLLVYLLLIEGFRLLSALLVRLLVWWQHSRVLQLLSVGLAWFKAQVLRLKRGKQFIS